MTNFEKLKNGLTFDYLYDVGVICELMQIGDKCSHNCINCREWLEQECVD